MGKSPMKPKQKSSLAEAKNQGQHQPAFCQRLLNSLDKGIDSSGHNMIHVSMNGLRTFNEEDRRNRGASPSLD